MAARAWQGLAVDPVPVSISRVPGVLRGGLVREVGTDSGDMRDRAGGVPTGGGGDSNEKKNGEENAEDKGFLYRLNVEMAKTRHTRRPIVSHLIRY